MTTARTVPVTTEMDGDELDAELRGDLVQIAQALALQGRSFGHVCTPPLLFTMRKCLSTDFFTGLSKLEAPPPCLGL